MCDANTLTFWRSLDNGGSHLTCLHPFGTCINGQCVCSSSNYQDDLSMFRFRNCGLIVDVMKYVEISCLAIVALTFIYGCIELFRLESFDSFSLFCCESDSTSSSSSSSSCCCLSSCCGEDVKDRDTKGQMVPYNQLPAVPTASNLSFHNNKSKSKAEKTIIKINLFGCLSSIALLSLRILQGSKNTIIQVFIFNLLVYNSYIISGFVCIYYFSVPFYTYFYHYANVKKRPTLLGRASMLLSPAYDSPSGVASGNGTSRHTLVQGKDEYFLRRLLLRIQIFFVVFRIPNVLCLVIGAYVYQDHLDRNNDRGWNLFLCMTFVLVFVELFTIGVALIVFGRRLLFLVNTINANHPENSRSISQAYIKKVQMLLKYIPFLYIFCGLYCLAAAALVFFTDYFPYSFVFMIVMNITYSIGFFFFIRYASKVKSDNHVQVERHNDDDETGLMNTIDLQHQGLERQLSDKATKLISR